MSSNIFKDLQVSKSVSECLGLKQNAVFSAVHRQAIHKTAELHERTIGRAVESLAQDETLAQLLELKQFLGAGPNDPKA